MSPFASVAFKSTPWFHEPVNGAFAGMAEWRMPEIVREARGFHEIGIDEEVIAEQPAGAFQPRADTAADLGDFDAVRQARAVKVVFS